MYYVYYDTGIEAVCVHRSSLTNLVKFCNAN